MTDKAEKFHFKVDITTFEEKKNRNWTVHYTVTTFSLVVSEGEND